MSKNKGFKRIRMAGVYAFNGIMAAWRHEAAFRQEVLLAVLFVPLTFILTLSSLERVVLIAVTVLVVICELVNSAIEAVVDRVGTEHHELSKRAKDMGSGAVLLCLILWIYVWFEIVIIGLWLGS